jgi:choline dehydrogenase-like flavoprotein
MSIRSASRLREGERVEADVCVVGAGAAGIALALGFEKSPLSVCLIESGSFRHREDSDALNELDNVGRPLNVSWKIRNRAFGGTTTSWAGRCARLDPIDFEARPWVPESGWPIDRHEVERSIPEAETILGVTTPEAFAPRFWETDPVHQALELPELSPRAHIIGRRFRMGKRYKSTLRRSATTTVIHDATVTELVAPAESSRVQHAECLSRIGRRFRVTAAAFVIACGGIENPRLLLLSRRHRSAGLGNDHDQVGRYYMNHPRGDSVGRLFLEPGHPHFRDFIAGLTMGFERRVGARMQLAVAPRADFMRREEILNISSFFYGSSLQRLARLKPSLEAITEGIARRRLTRPILGHAVRLFAEAPLLAEATWYRARRIPFMIDHLVLVDQVEQLPNPESRVTLSDRRDRVGQPLVRLDWKIDTSVVRTHRVFYRALDARLRQRGIGRIESPLLEDESFEPEYTDCAHPAGTTRMHVDARKGVVDTDCRVHGLANLFVAGGSVFPTVGNAAPTLTIVALATRLANHLQSLFASGRMGH